MEKQSKIYVAGHNGMVGSALIRKLKLEGFTNLIVRSSRKLDLTRQYEVEQFFNSEKPEYVFLAAAKVGGILANSKYKAQFIYDNNIIAANVIHSAYKSGVTKLINLGSSCIYPKMAEQPLKEEYLLTGPLEPTNDAYAIAKITALKMCNFYHEQYNVNFFSAMPTNMYGPNDNYNPESSHMIPALIRKIHTAKTSNSPVIIWGDGSPLREALYVDDLADALLFMMDGIDAEHLSEGFLNVGSGIDNTIREYAEIIANVIGYKGSFEYDTSKPNGTPRKIMDVSKMEKLGWKYKTDLPTGIQKAYEWFLENYTKLDSK